MNSNSGSGGSGSGSCCCCRQQNAVKNQNKPVLRCEFKKCDMHIFDKGGNLRCSEKTALLYYRQLSKQQYQ